MVKVGLAVIHGMGSQGIHYADGFLSLVQGGFAAGLRAAGARPARGAPSGLATKALVLTEVLKTRERRFLQDYRKDHRLGWGWLRTFVGDYLGDAIAYQRDERGDVYARTHILIAEGLNDLDREMGPGSTVALAAHSLGTIVASNYIYDVQARKVPAPVEEVLLARASRLESFTHLWTFGSPLALWTLRYPDFGEPIRFPHRVDPRLEPPEWVNSYDRDDVIAWPLKPLSPKWDGAVTRDAEVQSGNWLIRWTPFSHIGYWTCRPLAREIGRRLARDWLALNGETAR